MTSWHLGSVGWGYEEWRGVFYPSKMNGRQFLAHYAQFFDAVEVDSTFYGTPPVSRVINWARAVPDHFIFCPKTPRQITHDNRLLQPELMAEFVEVVSHFASKLGVILIQLPPNFTTAEIEVMRTFLKQLPTGFRYAVEFRHTSWDISPTVDLLTLHNVAWVGADYVIMPKQVIPTADFTYLRFLGRHGRYQFKDRELRDPIPELERWYSEHLQPNLGRWTDIYGFFNNDYAGYSPESCNHLKKMIGLPTSLPLIPRQGTLF